MTFERSILSVTLCAWLTQEELEDLCWTLSSLVLKVEILNLNSAAAVSEGEALNGDKNGLSEPQQLQSFGLETWFWFPSGEQGAA